MDLDMITTDKILDELEDRERIGHGHWTGRQIERLRVLAVKLNPGDLDELCPKCLRDGSQRCPIRT